jgi:hypothetical protein
VADGGVVVIVGDPAVNRRHYLGAALRGQEVGGQKLLAGGVEVRAPRGIRWRDAEAKTAAIIRAP